VKLTNNPKINLTLNLLYVIFKAARTDQSKHPPKNAPFNAKRTSDDSR